MKKLCLVLLAFLVLSTGLSSCSLRNSFDIGNKQDNSISSDKNEGDVMDRGPVNGGVLKLFSTIPDTMNPILTDNVYVHDFLEFVFEGLVKLDSDQRPVPELADRWEVSSDGLTWTFYMSDNVSWQDGMPFTAEDAEFTIETILNAKVNSVYKKNVDNIAAFTAIDRNILKITLKKPNSFTAELMTFPIISKHYFSGEDINKSSRNMSPMGTGPYKFLSYDGKNIAKLIVNENWWKAGPASKDKQALPYIGEIDVALYKNGKDALNAFQARDIDVTFIGAEDFGRYNGRTDVLLKKYTDRSYDFISINLSNPVLSDKAVRQALAYAVDKVGLINNIMPGEAIAADIPVIPDTWLYNNDVLYYSPSSSKAKELLVQNGWKEDEDTGELYKKINGVVKTLTLEMLVNDDNDLRVKVAEEIQRQLAQAGIKLNIVKTKWDDEFGKINSKKYQLALVGLNIPSTEDISFLYASSEIASGTNTAGYNNPDVDNYLKQILAENDDTQKKALFYNMRSLINEEVPYIGLYFYNNAILLNKKIRGELSSYFFDKYSGYEKCYIPVTAR